MITPSKVKDLIIITLIIFLECKHIVVKLVLENKAHFFLVLFLFEAVNIFKNKLSLCFKDSFSKNILTFTRTFLLLYSIFTKNDNWKSVQKTFISVIYKP